ncbi:MAG: SgcJ/EcaC family oxidoreductase [Chlamydiia bacterium]|nr:SgcJ/EcaC family oxidoreductase [Chlamydiia bacterium]
MKKMFFVLLFCAAAFALDTQDEVLIKGIVDQYVESWNHHAGKGFGSGFSKDADFINIFGMTFSGREEIEDRHVEILQTFLKDSTFEVTDFKLREATPGVVIALVSWKVDGLLKPGKPKEVIHGVFSHTFVKTGNSWEIVACQNTLSKS